KYHRTPLHIAAFEGSEEILGIVLDHGADPDVQDSFGLTPLHLAVTEGHEGVCRALLERGADTNTKDLNGRTPLGVALLESKAEIADLLRSYHAV
ncbi:MAG: ankyrin repeat domain-containing protein, partial [Candidatus Omnitrophica bacterium]|nr:ankyrin repeat domain-containing protein [Candidatus Omnitrophota bacterium]